MPRRGIETTIIPMTPEQRRVWDELNATRVLRMYGDGARPATTVPTTLSAMAPPVAPAAPSVAPSVVPAVVAPAVAEPSRKTLHVHTTRRCAYRKWAPDIAAKCECWRCVAAREYARCFAPGGPRVIIIKAEPAKEPAKEPARDAAA